MYSNKSSLISPIFILLFSLSSAYCQNKEPSMNFNDVDLVIKKYIEAIGGYSKIKELNNLSYSGGTYSEGDYTGSGKSTMSLARPYYKLVGNKNNPRNYMEGYDGAAWEWFKSPGIVLRTVGSASEAIRHNAGVENPLIDYKEKGSVAKLLGDVKFDNKNVFVLQLKRIDGYVEQYYIDKKEYLIVATSGEAPIHAFGDDVFSLTRISDYRSIEGVLIAHRFEQLRLPSNEPLSSMQWKKIEGNVDFPSDWFTPPIFQRTKLQTFIENLYWQKTDINSVLWTYHEFRRAYKNLETNEAVDFAGFQILKMGEVDNAIAILEQNLKDYPNALNTNLQLGIAYKTANRSDDAREQFLTVLKVDPENKRAKSELDKLNQN